MVKFQPVIPQLAFLLQVTVALDPALLVGTMAIGTRRIINITGGHFTGQTLTGEPFAGEVLSGGADWQLVRTDGVALLEARYTLRTTDGALIYVQNRGVRHGPADVLAALARSEAVDPASYYMRTTPTFETGAARYQWLNDLIAVGSGLRQADAVVLDFYRVT
ncbi:MAG: DUF3237 domain-containing protein [Caldilineaceae bacterium]